MLQNRFIHFIQFHGLLFTQYSIAYFLNFFPSSACSPPGGSSNKSTDSIDSIFQEFNNNITNTQITVNENDEISEKGGIS